MKTLSLFVCSIFVLMCISCGKTENTKSNENDDTTNTSTKTKDDSDSDQEQQKDDNDENQKDDADTSTKTDEIIDNDVVTKHDYTVNENCVKLFTIICEKEVSCSFTLSATVAKAYVDCKSQAQDICSLVAVSDSFAIETALSTEIDSCITEIKTGTCDILDSDISLGVCDNFFSGTLEIGEPCLTKFTKNCKGGYCSTDGENLCGICAPMQKIGDSCDDDDFNTCQISEEEFATCVKGKCQNWPKENEVCIEDWGCADHLYCDAIDPEHPVCKKVGIAKEGEYCNYDHEATECDIGLECDWDIKKCVELKGKRQIGETCDSDSDCVSNNDSILMIYCKKTSPSDENGICRLGTPQVGEQCPSMYWCSFALVCDMQTNTCIEKKNDGDNCDPEDEGWDCKSHYCDPVTSKCAYPVCE